MKEKYFLKADLKNIFGNSAAIENTKDSIMGSLYRIEKKAEDRVSGSELKNIVEEYELVYENLKKMSGYSRIRLDIEGKRELEIDIFTMKCLERLAIFRKRHLFPLNQKKAFHDESLCFHLDSTSSRENSIISGGKESYKIHETRLDRIINDYYGWFNTKLPLLSIGHTTLDSSEYPQFFAHGIEKVRVDSYNQFWNGLAKNGKIVSKLYNNFINLKISENKNYWRNENFSSYINGIEGVTKKSFDSLQKATIIGRDIFRKYLKWKFKKLDIESSRSNLYAPLIPPSVTSLTKALLYISKSLNDFDSNFYSIQKRIIKEKRIDVGVERYGGKNSYCYSLDSKNLSYITTNYSGGLDSIFQLSHEFGHAIHDHNIRNKSVLIRQPKTPLAEISANFSEELCEKWMLENKKTTIPSSEVIATRIEDSFSGIIRQLGVMDFQKRAFELVAKDNDFIGFNELYYQIIKNQFGNSISVPKNASNEWKSYDEVFGNPFKSSCYPMSKLFSIWLSSAYQRNPELMHQKIVHGIYGSDGMDNFFEVAELYGFNPEKKHDWLSCYGIIEGRFRQLKKSYLNS